MSIRMGVVAAVLALSGAARADVYVDSQFDIFDNGFAHLDIAQVTMTNDATNLYIEATMRGSIASPDWGKYVWFFDTKAGGRTDNPWVRNIENTVESDYFIGSWVDGGGSYQIWSDTGSGWNHDSTNPVDLSAAAAGTVKYTISLAALGLGVGDLVLFDLASTGGSDGDPGVDHLSNPSMATPGWGTGSRPGDFLRYTVVPTPGVGAIFGFAMVGGLRRRR